MNEADVWDVRHPDGRTFRSLPTDTVCEYLRSRRLPASTLVRRGDEEEWTGLDWVPEFAPVLTELANGRTPPPSKSGTPRAVRPTASQTNPGITVADRLELPRFGGLGVPAILREVLTALDLTLLPLKLRLVAFLGSLVGLLLVLPSTLDWKPEWLLAAQLGGVLLILAVGGAVLSQLVYAELSRNRAGRWRDARRGLVGHTLRLFFSLLLMPGVGIALLVGLLWIANGPLAVEAEEAHAMGRIGPWLAAGGAVLLAIPLVAFGPMALMLAPILVVEECGIFKALGQWFLLLRANLSRALLYDLLATGILLFFLAVPASLVVGLGWLPLDPRYGSLVVITQGILTGMLAALGLAYLLVVQVFLYLNLRFDVAE